MALQEIGFVVGLLFGLSSVNALGLEPGLRRCVGALFGMFYPLIWVNDQVKKRHLQITRALPYNLDLLTLSVEAGLDFTGALAKVVEKGKGGPLREELQLVLKQLKMGKTREEALKAMIARVDLPSLTTFVTALIQADKMGTSLGKVLRIQSTQLRIDRTQRAEKLAERGAGEDALPADRLHLPHGVHGALRADRVRLHVRQRRGVVPLPFPLTITQGPAQVGRELAFEQAEVNIGRTSENDVVLHDPVSPGVTCASSRADGRYFAADVGSANGTQLNGQLLSGEKQLRDGDRITVGPVEFTFVWMPPEKGDDDVTRPIRRALAPPPREGVAAGPGAGVARGDRSGAPPATSSRCRRWRGLRLRRVLARPCPPRRPGRPPRCRWRRPSRSVLPLRTCLRWVFPRRRSRLHRCRRSWGLPRRSGLLRALPCRWAPRRSDLLPRLRCWAPPCRSNLQCWGALRPERLLRAGFQPHLLCWPLQGLQRTRRRGLPSVHRCWGLPLRPRVRRPGRPLDLPGQCLGGEQGSGSTRIRQGLRAGTACGQWLGFGGSVVRARRGARPHHGAGASRGRRSCLDGA